jgi:hypothetical protein
MTSIHQLLEPSIVVSCTLNAGLNNPFGAGPVFVNQLGRYWFQCGRRDLSEAMEGDDVHSIYRLPSNTQFS